jgi:hypothetical protein
MSRLRRELLPDRDAARAVNAGDVALGDVCSVDVRSTDGGTAVPGVVRRSTDVEGATRPAFVTQWRWTGDATRAKRAGAPASPPMAAAVANRARARATFLLTLSRTAASCRENSTVNAR